MNDETPTAGLPAQLAGTTLGGPDGNTHIPQLSDGYELDAEIARGGMGVVYRARDVAMSREVAVKILQDKFPLDGPAARRFVEEAQITGQLQHPGIPPIHHIGKWEDGRPFLAMKLIKGRTLDTLVKDRGPVNTLAVFEAIAQAVGYAHAHGVIHRDLKPANVMVGSFAEVQVMDWGLAKVLSPQREQGTATDPDATLGTEIRSLRESQDETHAGSVLGTPAFMPPEQAIGATDEVDVQSDVFGLGAILCVMLTGRPPYVAANAESTRKLAARAKLDEAFEALDACAAEPGMVALCKRCLSAEKAERPANGDAVATEVAALRTAAEERAKQAEIERAKAGVREAEQRKRRRAFAWSAVAVFAVLTAGIAASLWQAVRATTAEAATAAQLDQTKVAERATAAQLVKTQKAEAAATARAKEIEAAQVVVEERTRLALNSIDDMVLGLRAKLNQPGMEDVRKTLVRSARTGLAKIVDAARLEHSPNIARWHTHVQIGDLEQTLGNDKEAQKEFQLSYELAKQLADADPEHQGRQFAMALSLHRLGETALGRGRPQESWGYFEKELTVRKKMLDTDPNNVDDRRDLCECYVGLGNTAMKLGHAADASEPYVNGMKISQALLQADPENVENQSQFNSCCEKLGSVMLKLHRPAEALDCYRDVLRLRQEMLDINPEGEGVRRQLFLSHLSIGEALSVRGDLPQASKAFQEALQLSHALAEADRTNVFHQRLLASSYDCVADVAAKAGSTKAAVEYYELGLGVRRTLAETGPVALESHGDLLSSYEYLGNVLLSRGNSKAAIKYYRLGLKLSQQLADANPNNNDEMRRRMSSFFHDLGQEELELESPTEAIAFHQKGLKVRQDMASAEPKNPERQDDLATSCELLGAAMLKREKAVEALEYYRSGLKVRQALVDADPKNLDSVHNLLNSFDLLGEALLKCGNPREGLEFFQKAFRVRQAQLKAAPKNVQIKLDLASSHSRLGDAMLELGQGEEAYQYYQEWLRVHRSLLDADLKNTLYRINLSNCYAGLGERMRKLGRPDDALEYYDRAVTVRRWLLKEDPTSDEAQREVCTNLWRMADVYEQQRRWREALASYEKAEQLAAEYSKPDFHADELRTIREKVATYRLADQAIADLEFAFQQDTVLVPKLLDVRVKTLLHRQRPADAVATARRFGAWAEDQENDRELHRYYAAGAFALCASAIDRDREKLIDQCLTLLDRAKFDGYFSPSVIARLKGDEEFDGIREHPKFVSFLKEVETYRQAAPRPREAK